MTATALREIIVNFKFDRRNVSTIFNTLLEIIQQTVIRTEREIY